HLQHDLVFAGGGLGVLVAGRGAGGRRGDHFAVAADGPLQAQAPVVAYVAADHLATLQANLGVGDGVELLLHRAVSGGVQVSRIRLAIDGYLTTTAQTGQQVFSATGTVSAPGGEAGGDAGRGKPRPA